MLASYVLHEWQDRNAGPTVELSTRERQVLSLVAAGERDQDIAELLAISIRTVRSYLDRIRDKTGQRRRPELTRYAIEKGVAYVRQLSA
jgi:DNA-binding NarL/FixJ family response regulator